MTQAAQAPPPPAAAPAPQPSVVQYPAPHGAPVGRTVVDTPALLNRWQLIGMAIAIVFGLVCAFLQFLGWQADGRAANDTEQLIRVQDIQSSLLHADALATNSFLDAGTVDPDQLQEYDDTIARVFGEISAAAEAQPADQEALAKLNVAVNDYANAVDTARAYNRYGFPVGPEYLSEASAALRADAIPILQNLVDANSDRAQGSMDGQHPIWLLLAGVLALVGLWWLNRQLAQHFRRRINVGLAVAAVIVLLVTVVSAAAAWKGDNQNDGLRDDELAAAMDQAAARPAANDAKANESLRLSKRGSGAAYEDPWKAAAAIVEKTADPDTLSAWHDYTSVHQQMMKLEDTDLHPRALAIAANPGKGGSTAPFTVFDDASAQIVAENGSATTDELRAGRALAFVGVLLTLFLGVVAAVAVARGVGVRRREYA